MTTVNRLNSPFINLGRTEESCRRSCSALPACHAVMYKAHPTASQRFCKGTSRFHLGADYTFPASNSGRMGYKVFSKSPGLRLKCVADSARNGWDGVGDNIDDFAVLNRADYTRDWDEELVLWGTAEYSTSSWKRGAAIPHKAANAVSDVPWNELLRVDKDGKVGIITSTHDQLPRPTTHDPNSLKVQSVRNLCWS